MSELDAVKQQVAAGNEHQAAAAAALIGMQETLNQLAGLVGQRDVVLKALAEGTNVLADRIQGINLGAAQEAAGSGLDAYRGAARGSDNTHLQAALHAARAVLDGDLSADVPGLGALGAGQQDCWDTARQLAAEAASLAAKFHALQMALGGLGTMAEAVVISAQAAIIHGNDFIAHA